MNREASGSAALVCHLESPRGIGLRILGALFDATRPAAGGEAAGTTPPVPSGDGAPRSTVEGPCRPETRPSPFTLTAFQLEAVDRARRTLDLRGGLILADAVGLGKTFVALRLVEETLEAGGDAWVIVPAALRRTWSRQLGRLPAARQRARVLSHAQMSRGATAGSGTRAGPALIVVDEAHRFRNPRTRRYAALGRLVLDSGAGRASPSRLLLITATPVNNEVDDLYHLIRLFAPDDILGDVGIPSLRGAFEAVRRAPDASGRAGIRTVVRHLVIRRTRGHIRDRFGGQAAVRPGVSFPRRGPPVVVGYPAPLMGELVRRVGALELAAYGPVYERDGPVYRKTEDSRGLLRLGLLKRLESSPAAARSSLERLRAFCDLVREAAGAGRVVRPGDRPGAGGDADPLQLVMTDLVATAASPTYDLAGLAASAARDRRRIDELLQRLGGPGDPKLSALLELLDTLAPEPVILFTEFRDTAAYLGHTLSRTRKVGRIDGTGAWLGRHRAGRRTVVERFAPMANGRAPPPAREAVDILVATDVLAEGMNLQDARHVISYDLPWNPVRLLQRIGRVDRLGSTHPEVVPHLFCPEDGLEQVLGLTRRLRVKLDGILSVVGEDGGEELLRALASEPDRVPAVLEAAERAASGDATEALRTLWIRNRGGADVERARQVTSHRHGPTSNPGSDRHDSAPARLAVATLCVDAEHPAAGLRALVLMSGHHAARLLEVARDGSVDEPGEAGVAALASALECTERRILPWKAAHAAAAEAREVADAVMTALRDGDAAPLPRQHTPSPRRDTASRLALRLGTALAAAGSAAHPQLLDRAEAVLARLAQPLPPGLEPEAEGLLHGQPPDAATLTRRIEAALRADRSWNPTGPMAPEPEGERIPVAVLRILRNAGPGAVDDPSTHD